MVIQGNVYPSDFEAKKLMIDIGRELEQKNYAVAGDGSMSVRIGPNAVWFCLEGADKGALKQDDFIRTDLNGRQQLSRSGRQLPSDYLLHLEVYRQNDKVRSIIHAYPPAVTAMGLKGCGAEPADFTPAVRLLGRIPYTAPDTPEETARQAGLICREANGMVIGRDGCVMWAESVRRAMQLTQALDYYENVRKASGCCESRRCASCGKFQNGCCCQQQCPGSGQCGEGVFFRIGRGTEQNTQNNTGSGSMGGTGGAMREGLTPVIHPGEKFDFSLPESGKAAGTIQPQRSSVAGSPAPVAGRTAGVNGGSAARGGGVQQTAAGIPAPHPVTISSPSNSFATDWRWSGRAEEEAPAVPRTPWTTGSIQPTRQEYSGNGTVQNSTVPTQQPVHVYKKPAPVTISMPPSNVAVTKAVNSTGNSSYRSFNSAAAASAAPLHGTGQASAQCPSNVTAQDQPLPYVRKDGPVKDAPKNEIMAEVVRRTIKDMKF